MIYMNKEVITSKQATFLIGIFIMGTAILISGQEKALQDIWISLLIAFLLFIPIIFIYSSILSSFPGKNLYEIIEICFGKVIGKLVSLLFIMYFFYIATLILRNITEFIQVTTMPRTPQYFSGLWFILIAAYMVKSGIEVFARWTNLVFVFLVLLILMSMIASVNQYDYENILPILYRGWEPILDSALSIFVFPFGETIVFLSFFHTLEDNTRVWRPYLVGGILGGSLVGMASIRNTFLLGYPLIEDIYFPSYYANTIITIGKFIDGMEVFSATILVLAGFAKLSACLFAICLGLKNLFGSKGYGSFIIPVGICLLILSQIIFSSTMEMRDNVKYYKYIALPFQLVLPLIIFIFTRVKRRNLQ